MAEERTTLCSAEEDPKLASAGQRRHPKEVFDDPPLVRAVLTYVSYLVLYVVSLVSDFLRRIGLKSTGYKETFMDGVRLLSNASAYYAYIRVHACPHLPVSLFERSV